MVLVAATLAFLPWLVPQDLPPGPCKVTVQSASFNKVPSTTRGFLREAKVGEEVTVLSVEGNYAKVKLAEGGEAYISKTALVASDSYVKAPANEKEMMEMKGKGYEAGRFDPETESSYKKEKGPEMEKAYKGVDAWEERQGWAAQRGEVAKRLEEFRKAGKLAEFSTVK
jgi:hypothetical protein